mgnify:CR=1 FL=1
MLGGGSGGVWLERGQWADEELETLGMPRLSPTFALSGLVFGKLVDVVVAEVLRAGRIFQHWIRWRLPFLFELSDSLLLGCYQSFLLLQYCFEGSKLIFEGDL